MWEGRAGRKGNKKQGFVAVPDTHAQDGCLGPLTQPTVTYALLIRLLTERRLYVLSVLPVAY